MRVKDQASWATALRVSVSFRLAGRSSWPSSSGGFARLWAVVVSKLVLVHAARHEGWCSRFFSF